VPDRLTFCAAPRRVIVASLTITGDCHVAGVVGIACSCATADIAVCDVGVDNNWGEVRVAGSCRNSVETYSVSRKALETTKARCVKYTWAHSHNDTFGSDVVSHVLGALLYHKWLCKRLLCPLGPSAVACSV
jgi:hypothetical protein